MENNLYVDCGSRYRNSQVIASSQLGDLSDVSEGGTHHDGLVVVFLVVVEDALHALDTRILMRSEVLLHRGLVPVEDAPDERRDEECPGFCSGNGLDEREHERQVTVDAMLGLEDVRGLDAFPG